VRVLGLLAAFCCVLALAPSAWSLEWSGSAPSGSPEWSLGANWAGAPPSLLEPFTLEFPRLVSPTCASASPSETCYVSKNDVGNVAVEALRVDDGDEYELEGDGITLGSGGLAASPATGSSGPAGDYVGFPIELGASQTWSVAERSGGGFGENGVFVEGAITGPGRELTLDVGNGAGLYLHNDTEVGSLTLAGADPTQASALNGFVALLGAEVNSSNGGAVNLSHILVVDKGSVGALTTHEAELGVGAGGIQAQSATLDAGSTVEFEITGSGTVADSDYGQLSSGGPISLGGVKIGVLVAPTSGAQCPTPQPGQTYTLVSTTGTLSGSFGNAPEGAEIPVHFSEECASQPSVHLRIAYHESGSTQTVTGTVPGGKETSEPEKNTVNPYVKPNAEGATWGAISGALAVAEYHARVAREEAERQARIAQQNAATVATSASSAVSVQRNGTALVKLACSGSAGGQGCAGKLTLSAQIASKGRRRSHTLTIAAAGFSIAASSTATVQVKLSATGRALLRKDRGRLNASLAILQSAPATHSQTRGIHLLQARKRATQNAR
jgi:hypothetical protein